MMKVYRKYCQGGGGAKLVAVFIREDEVMIKFSYGLAACFILAVANLLMDPVKWEGCKNCLPADIPQGRASNFLPADMGEKGYRGIPEYVFKKNPVANTGDTMIFKAPSNYPGAGSSSY